MPTVNNSLEMVSRAMDTDSPAQIAVGAAGKAVDGMVGKALSTPSPAVVSRLKSSSRLAFRKAHSATAVELEGSSSQDGIISRSTLVYNHRGPLLDIGHGPSTLQEHRIDFTVTDRPRSPPSRTRTRADVG